MTKGSKVWCQPQGKTRYFRAVVRDVVGNIARCTVWDGKKFTEADVFARDLLERAHDNEPPPVTAMEAADQLEYELKLRARFFPRWIEGGKITQDSADYRTACMKKALELVRRAAHEG